MPSRPHDPGADLRAMKPRCPVPFPSLSRLFAKSCAVLLYAAVSAAPSHAVYVEALTNGGFELSSGDASLTTYRIYPPHNAFVEVAGSNALANTTGWRTTAPDEAIEVWKSGFNGVNTSAGTGPAQGGTYFAEINANVVASLYQDVTFNVAAQADYFFMHRARQGSDTMRFTITDFGTDNTFGTGDDVEIVSFAVTNNTTNEAGESNGWRPYFGNNVFTSIPGRTYRVALSAISTGSGSPSVGNFIDSVSFGAELETQPNFGPPTVSDIPNQSVVEDGNTGAIAFTVGDSVTPAASLTVTAFSEDTSIVTPGGLTLGGSGANRTLTVVPVANAFGDVTITIAVNDGSFSTVETFVLTVLPVNDAPSFTKGANITVAEDAGAQTIAGWATALSRGPANESAQTLSFTVSNNANGLFSAQPAISPSGTLTFTPAANANGSATVTVSIQDNGGTLNGGVNTSATQTFTITVNPANDAPVATGNSYGTSEDVPLVIAGPGVLGNDGDLDGDTLTAVLVTGVSHGSLTLNANGSFTYTPSPNYFGPDSFTYKANDGSLDSNIVTVSLAVEGVNDAPLAVANSYSVDEDAIFNVNAPGVLGNDSDPEGNALNAVLVTGTANGTLTLNANGSFTYSPNANYFGPDSFTYKANDGGLDSNTVTVSITVNPINDPPVAVANSYSLDEDTTLTLNAPGVLGNDSDSEGSALNAILVTGVSHGTLTLNANGSLTYTPAANYVGPDSFTYKANDGTLDSNVVTVTLAIEPLNDAPVAVANSYTVDEDAILSIGAPGVLGNDSDQEGSGLTAVLVSGVAHGTLTLNANGSFLYSPAANYFGPDSFTYKANDGTLDSNVVTVSITVNPINDAPIAVGNSYPVNEDTTLTVNAPGVMGNDSDAEGSGLTAVLVAGPANGTLTLNANGSFSYSPNANYAGSDSFTYKVNDGSLDSNVVTVALSVEAVNDAPVAVANSYSVDEGTTLTVNAPGLLGDDSDVEGSALSAVLVTGPANGTLTLNANGSFSYTPNANYSGPDSFTYKANDGTLDSNVVTVSLTVREVNSAPVAVANGYSVDEDGVLTIGAPGLLGNDSDPENDTLTAVLVTGVAHGTLTLNPNGSFTYTPAANYAGADSFTYKANDGTLDSNIVTVSFTVNPINDAPIAVANGYAVDVNTALNVNAPGLLGNDSDAEAGSLTALLVSGVAHGTLNFNANGSFDYTPAANYLGTDSFTYKINDGSLDSNVVTVSINVRPVSGNRIPTVNAPSTLTTSTGIAIPFTVTMADPDLDPLTLTISTPSNGTVTGSGTSYIYTPAPGFVGSDSFMVTASDGRGGSASKLIRVTVFAPAGLVGNYALHLRDPEGNIHAHLLLTTTRMGRATGVVSVGGGRYTVRGFFGGSAKILAPRSRGLGSVQLRLETGQSPLGVPELVVEVDDGTTTYTGRSPRSPYSATNPAPQAGKYTIIASRDSRVIARTGAVLEEPTQAIPTVAASLTARVRPNGVVVINGYTGHGYRLTCSSYVMAGSQVPWFSGRMAPGASVQYSTFTFPADPVVPNDTTPAVTGLLNWHAEADSRIPAPFSGEYAVLGGRYTPPTSGPTLLNSNELAIKLDVPSYVTEGTVNPQIEVRPFTGNLLHHVEGNISSVRITFASGVYIGRIMGRVTRPFFGVIIQGETIDGGMGSLIDFDAIGTSELLPSRR